MVYKLVTVKTEVGSIVRLLLTKGIPEGDYVGSGFGSLVKLSLGVLISDCVGLLVSLLVG